MLVFDPTDGILELRRIFVELRPRDNGLSLPASVPGLGTTSVSLPGMGGAGRLGVSPPTSNAKAPWAVSNAVQVADSNMDLVGKESVVATWSLQRQPDWKEIKQVVEEPAGEQGKIAKTEYVLLFSLWFEFLGSSPFL